VDDWSDRRTLTVGFLLLAVIGALMLAAGVLVFEVVAWLVGECRG
jgi:hypothetical protein